MYVYVVVENEARDWPDILKDIDCLRYLFFSIVFFLFQVHIMLQSHFSYGCYLLTRFIAAVPLPVAAAVIHFPLSYFL